MLYDAVLVLANEMSADGILNFESRSRCDLASNLIKKGHSPLIITCGWNYRSDSKIKIADALKAYLIESGVRVDQIISDVNSRDTVGDAVFTRVNIAEPMGLTSICVVTSVYHVPRVQKIFDFVYGKKVKITVFGVDVPFTRKIIHKELASMLTFYNTFSGVDAGDLNRIIDTLKLKHPFYNGKMHPKI